MNGHQRLQYAAERNGTWDVSEDAVEKMMRTQEFVSSELELWVQVTYSGYTVKGAMLWDFSSKIITNAENGVPMQRLTAADQGKADRIADVLLGNSRRF